MTLPNPTFQRTASPPLTDSLDVKHVSGEPRGVRNSLRPSPFAKFEKRWMRLGCALVVCLLTACENSAQYHDAEDFQSSVQSWHLEGKPQPEVVIALQDRGFVCKGMHCSREVKGFPCLQLQYILLMVNLEGNVEKLAVEKTENGQIGRICV